MEEKDARLEMVGLEVAAAKEGEEVGELEAIRVLDTVDEEVGVGVGGAGRGGGGGGGVDVEEEGQMVPDGITTEGVVEAVEEEEAVTVFEGEKDTACEIEEEGEGVKV